MKRLVFFVSLFFLLFACEGKQGPVGPQGPQGDPGPQGPPGESGATIIYEYGVIAIGDYGSGYIHIYSSYLAEEDVVQFYVSPDQSVYAWLCVSEIELTNGLLYAYDPYGDFLGWDYMLKIIKSTG